MISSNGYLSDNLNPTFDTLLEKMAFDAKLIGLNIEKEYMHMIALAPKLYMSFNNDFILVQRVKKTSVEQNPMIIDNYKTSLTKDDILKGVNINLKLHSGIMSKITNNKIAIFAIHNKMYIVNESTNASIKPNVNVLFLLEHFRNNNVNI